MPEAVPGQLVPYCTVALFMRMGARRLDRARAQINIRRGGGVPCTRLLANVTRLGFEHGLELGRALTTNRALRSRGLTVP